MDAQLRRLAGDGLEVDWKQVARQMIHWSARQCEARFNKLIAEDGGWLSSQAVALVNSLTDTLPTHRR